MRTVLPLVALLVFASACSEDPAEDAAVSDLGVDAGPSDTGASDRGVDAATDSGVRDADPGDVGAEDVTDLGVDAAAPDGGADDAGAQDATPSDATVDGGPGDAAADGGQPCDYLDLNLNIVLCPGGYEYLRGFEDLNQNPACAPYWELRGNSYATSQAAIAGEGCGATCVYQASTSVSLIDPCGRRNGYIIYTASGCPDLYEFAEGLFPSVEAWEAQLNCGG